MYAGMRLKEFKKEWLLHFATNISKRDIENKVVKTGNYIWHIFSWELVNSNDYLTGEKARHTFNKTNKANAWYIIPFERNASVRILNFENITAEQLDEENEIYIVARDFSWTYIKTHEDDLCGPYFYCIKP